jgi:hypothetical protein
MKIAKNNVLNGKITQWLSLKHGMGRWNGTLE